MAMQQIQYTARKLLWRAARGPALLAALLLGLLLIQPTLCIINCAASANHSSENHGDHQSYLLCMLASDPEPQGGHITVPAFWPSLPAIMGPALVQIALLLTLHLLIVAPLLSLFCSPPLPPPRASLASH